MAEDWRGTGERYTWNRKLIYSMAKNYRKGSGAPTYSIKDQEGSLLT
jgi:hypothetical protein